MSEAGDEPRAEDQLLREAATWFARMRGPDAEASRAAFEAWLARGALHRSAYNRAAEIFAMGKVLADEEPAALPAKQARRSAGGKLLPVAAVLAIVAGAWVAIGPIERNRRPAQDATGPMAGSIAATLTTGPGEQREIRLPDGSMVRLDPQTSVAARFTTAARRLTLERGSALFRVAHQVRPFVVYAGGGQVTARGTVFAVGFASDRRVSVRLFEGAIDVALPSARGSGGAAPVRRLHAGESLSYAAREREGPATIPSADPRAAAQSAAPSIEARDYDAILLAALIAQANRGAARPIRLALAATGERRVSGRFRIDDTDVLAQRLADLFGLEVDRSDPAVIVLRPR